MAGAVDGPVTTLHATEVELAQQPVEGYIFQSGGIEHSDRNGHICKIIGREDPDGDILDPCFKVRFGDGHETYAYSDELRPWYPT